MNITNYTQLDEYKVELIPDKPPLCGEIHLVIVRVT